MTKYVIPTLALAFLALVAANPSMAQDRNYGPNDGRSHYSDDRNANHWSSQPGHRSDYDARDRGDFQVQLAWGRHGVDSKGNYGYRHNSRRHDRGNWDHGRRYDDRRGHHGHLNLRERDSQARYDNRGNFGHRKNGGRHESRRNHWN
ncbi:MAG: hypothetical protein LBJ64_02425 [Deltaproteobacteria bacterium]|nr:hypothetical protein [Deltaproteobacteria bacterium]